MYGRDINLRDVEQLVYKATLREIRLPGGGVLFIAGSVPIHSLEQKQPSEVDLDLKKI